MIGGDRGERAAFRQHREVAARERSAAAEAAVAREQGRRDADDAIERGHARTLWNMIASAIARAGEDTLAVVFAETAGRLRRLEALADRFEGFAAVHDLRELVDLVEAERSPRLHRSEQTTEERATAFDAPLVRLAGLRREFDRRTPRIEAWLAQIARAQ